MRQNLLRSAFVLASACLLLSGCGASGPPTGKVVGRVEFNQQPISTGLVTFHSTESGIAATAKIAEGKFALDTPLEVGSYAVYVSPPVPEPRDPSLGPAPPLPVVNIPPRAQDPMTSGITISVAPGENDVQLELAE